MTETTLNSSSLNWRNYYNLCKPKVVYLIVFTAIVGMLLSTEGALPLDTFIAASMGIGLASASGAALNHWVDQRIDVVMERTSNRPLPQDYSIGVDKCFNNIVNVNVFGGLCGYLYNVS